MTMPGMSSLDFWVITGLANSGKAPIRALDGYGPADAGGVLAGANSRRPQCHALIETQLVLEHRAEYPTKCRGVPTVSK